MATSGGGDVLLVTHKLAAYGDNATCAAHKICSMLLQNEGRVYYTTVTPESFLAATKEQNEHQSLVGCSDLHLICPREPKGLGDKPSVSWISKLHCSYYDSFSHDDERLDDVGYIVGFVPTTANTAIDIADKIQFKAKANRKKDINGPKVVLINCTRIGEDQDNVIEDVEEWVQKPEVDVIFSIGNRLYEHYQGLYSGFNNAASIRNKHREFVFRPNSVFLDEQWCAPSFVKLASFWNTGTYLYDVAGTMLDESSVQDYESVCKMIGYMSSNSKLRGAKVPEWSVYGLKNSPKESAASLKSILDGAESFNILPKLEIVEEKLLLRVLRSFSAVIAPEHDSDGFNFQAWEAMGFGIPTFVADQSGIATTVKKLNSTVNFCALVKLVGSYAQDVEQWKAQVIRELTGEGSRPDLWALRLRDQIINSAYLQESEEQFIKYFGLCSSTEYRRVHSYGSLQPSVKSPTGYQETTPDTRMTGGGDGDRMRGPTGAGAGRREEGGGGAADASSQKQAIPTSQSGEIKRVCVSLKKTDAFQQGGAVTCSAEILQEIIYQQTASNPAQCANEHLVNCMNKHAEHGFQGVPGEVKAQWYAFLDALGAEDYEFFSARYDGESAVLSLYDSRCDGSRDLAQKIKDALIDYATLIDIDTNLVDVYPYDPTTSPDTSALSSGGSAPPGGGDGSAGDGADQLSSSDDASVSWSLSGPDGDSDRQTQIGATHDYSAQPSSSSDVSSSSLGGAGVRAGGGAGGIYGGGDIHDSGTSAEDLSEQMQGLGLDPPGTDLSLLEGQSIPRQQTMQEDDVIHTGNHGDEMVFDAGDARRGQMRVQATLDDGTDGTLPPKHELKQNGAKSSADSDTTKQSSATNQPSTNTCTSVQTSTTWAQSGANSAQSGANSAQSGANSAQSGTNSAQSGATSAQSGTNSAQSGATNAQSGTTGAQLGGTTGAHSGATNVRSGATIAGSTTGVYSGAHQRPATPQGLQVEDETNLKQAINESFPAGGQLSKYPEDKVLEGYKWFEWLQFKKLISKTRLWIESSALKEKIKPIVIAVLDTGIYEAHPALRNKMCADKSKCFVADELSQKDLRLDHLSHGTMVAGVIALNGPVNVKIINLKVQPAGGRPGDMRDLVRALEHIEKELNEEVHIVNMSMGQMDNPLGLSQAINRLADSKILIASAGNDAAKGANTVTYPALHPNVISVGAYDALGHMAQISAHGKEVDFLCPGKDIISTSNNGTYMKTNGTSFAAPHAAAIAAHVLVALQALAAEDPRFHAHITSAPISMYSTNFMRNFLVRMCTHSQQPGSQGQGHGILKPWENGFREDFLLKDHCKIALTGRPNYT